jgi:peptidoglycan/LPS O-acetylase OafA/YrhL
MKKETLMILITWTKRILGLIAFLIWGYVIFTISQSPAPFIEQAPYCMVGTMLIFGILTAVYKGLDYWSLNQNRQ